MDFKLYYPKKYLSAVDLRGKDVTLTIREFNLESLRGKGGTDEKKAVLYFEETAAKARTAGEEEKRMICNITNATTIAGLYTRDVDKWIGQRVTLFAAQEPKSPTGIAIRIRPTVPTNGAKPAPAPAPSHVDDDIPFGEPAESGQERETYDLAAHCKTCGGSYQTGAPVNARTGTCDGCVDGEADANMLAIDAIKLGDADMIGQGE